MTSLVLTNSHDLPSAPAPGRGDGELLAAWSRGDEGAFAEIYRRHREPLYRVLLRATGDRALTDELFQEVWLRVLNHRQRIRPESSFPAWLHRIAGNLLIDSHRRQRHSPLRALPHAEELAVDPAPGPEQVLARNQQAEGLTSALAELPVDQRIAFLLRAEYGMSLSEIADATGVGSETAKSRLRYALERLRRSLR